MPDRLTSSLREHPAARLVPELSEPEYLALLAGVRARGIVVPLEINEAGMVLDGRHRLRAARALDLERVPVRVVSPADEVEHMVLGTLQQRHLSQSQKACLAVRLTSHRQARAAGEARRRANLRRTADVATLPHRGRSRDHSAEACGVSARYIQDADSLERADPQLFARVAAGELPLKRAKQELKRRHRYNQIGDAPPLPDWLFDLIYADPPWQLGSPSSSGSPEQHYPTMETSEIAALQIPVAENAVLFLWSVSSLLPDALEVIAAWGFAPKSTMAWVKPSIGPGNYVRNRHELLLIATRGSYPTPLPSSRPDSVIEARRGRHSAKPKRFYDLIEQMYPHARRLELFARGKPRPGWTAWGNEVEQ